MAKYGKWIGAGLGLALGGPSVLYSDCLSGRCSTTFRHRFRDPYRTGDLFSGPNRAW